MMDGRTIVTFAENPSCSILALERDTILSQIRPSTLKDLIDGILIIVSVEGDLRILVVNPPSTKVEGFQHCAIRKAQKLL